VNADRVKISYAEVIQDRYARRLLRGLVDLGETRAKVPREISTS